MTSSEKSSAASFVKSATDVTFERIAISAVERINAMNEDNEATLGGQFTFPGTSLTVQRTGYGAMQLAGPGVWGPPRDQDSAVAVLREAVAAGVNHIDTS